MKAEYTHKPELYELTSLPNGKIQLTLRENISYEQREANNPEYTPSEIHEVYTEDGEVQEYILPESDVPEKITVDVWCADEYTLIVRPRHGLEADVAANISQYIAEAKSQEAKAAQVQLEKELEAEIKGDIVDTLLDYDYRLMMVEELGGGENGI